MPTQKPATGCGVYGVSNWATSSWVSTISSDANASSRCAGFRAPTIGAETTGLRDTHASAICARDTPRAAAIDATASTMTLSPVSYTHLRAHETGRNLVCRLLL